MRSPQIATIIHPYENGEPAEHEPERRSDPRWPYTVVQLVAFHEIDQQPTKEMLQAVQCHDISMGGMSFYLAHPPSAKYFTVLLGRPPDLIPVKARVVHTKLLGAPSREWKIGGQFLEKLERPLA